MITVWAPQWFPTSFNLSIPLGPYSWKHFKSMSNFIRRPVDSISSRHSSTGLFSNSTSFLIPLSRVAARSNPHPGYGVWVRGMSNGLVPTGCNSFGSLRAGRGEGVQIIHSGGWFARYRSTHATTGRASYTSLLGCSFPPKCYGCRWESSCHVNHMNRK